MTVRVELPQHLRTLAGVAGEVQVEVGEARTMAALLDAIEAAYPALRGTIREHGSRKRRALVRFFACGEDVSHEPQEMLLPEAVLGGREPFLIVGALAGG